MNLEDRIDAMINIMAVMIIIAAVALALLLMLALAPGVLIAIVSFVSVAFGLTYVPQLYGFIRDKWKNRK